MRATKENERNYLSQNPIRNLPAIVQAVKEEAEEIRNRKLKGLNKVQLFKDKKGFYKL